MVAPPYKYNDFSIHALLAESDHQTNAGSNESSDFLSTLSLRRATYDTYAKVLRVNFSIHALLAESDRVAFFFDVSFFLSTLSLRRATPMPCTKLITRFFLSTLSLRRATRCRPLCVAQYDFSIHALLAESDPCIPTGHSGALHFLSTLSLRRATNNHGDHIFGQKNFYPRSPCGERRPASRRDGANGADFYPRSPCGERPCNIVCG